MDPFRFIDIHAVDATGANLDGNEFSEEQVRQSALRILDSSPLCSIATVTAQGRAHINTAYFSYSEKLELYFWSHPQSLHCRSLSNNASMAVTVFSTQQPWGSPGQGVQLFGTCEATSESAAGEAERSYRMRFEGYENWKATLKDDDLARQYRFDVAAIRILDEKNWGDVWVRASVLRQ
ncbi:pyridoxamine 5'-phosphate oxidase family protein [Noviherbaspirillum saxi]|uniref:Pyridoxamine 5'-phosphate oxidase family protein n=1 Tax=Noviherbaspirillum saxi TaxID=2320863 RepID=A0A3A3G287_9BURK|nr:pyridoxamine 5'-phosphate oxidase family protein [Noviherbaspirillum saxi]RJF95546.1 pyridoxamine 5'-phosphate oxidase family protein [Noviherbaspirillum saxi]